MVDEVWGRGGERRKMREEERAYRVGPLPRVKTVANGLHLLQRGQLVNKYRYVKVANMQKTP